MPITRTVQEVGKAKLDTKLGAMGSASVLTPKLQAIRGFVLWEDDSATGSDRPKDISKSVDLDLDLLTDSAKAEILAALVGQEYPKA